MTPQVRHIIYKIYCVGLRCALQCFHKHSFAMYVCGMYVFIYTYILEYYGHSNRDNLRAPPINFHHLCRFPSHDLNFCTYFWSLSHNGCLRLQSVICPLECQLSTWLSNVSSSPLIICPAHLTRLICMRATI